MSIRQILKRHVRDGKLIQIKSAWSDDDDNETPRKMYVSKDVHAAILEPFPETETGRLRAELAAWMASFIENNEISVSEDPYDKPPDTMLARIDPPAKEFWSIRAFEDLDETGNRKSPGIRALGAFVAKNEFVALVWDTREAIGSDFNDLRDEVCAAWRDLFGAETPHKGANLNAYLDSWFSDDSCG